MSKLGGLIKGRCPRCGKGSVFQASWVGLLGITNERCPVCGLVFLRESGYFLGAMYISYGLGVFTILPAGLVTAIVLEWPLAIVIPLVIVLAIVLMPFYMRYSRIIWLYMDQVIDPR